MSVSVARSVDMVRSRAVQFMTSTCVISRPTPPEFDINTGFAGAGTGPTIYTGVCRVWEVTSGGVVVVGEDEIAQENTQLSIPWDVDPVPIRWDQAKITASDDANMVGRVFTLQSMAKSGLLRPTRRYSVRLVEEKNAFH